MFLVVVLDQVTKLLIVNGIEKYSQHEIIPGLFAITHTYNKGVAFGMFGGLSDSVRVLTIGTAMVVAFGMLLYFYWRHFRHNWGSTIAIALVAGGAIGNAIDRVRLGHVVDFLDFYISSWHWPAFNVADSAVCVGVAVLLFYQPKQVSDQEVSPQEASGTEVP